MKYMTGKAKMMMTGIALGTVAAGGGGTDRSG